MFKVSKEGQQVKDFLYHSILDLVYFEAENFFVGLLLSYDFLYLGLNIIPDIYLETINLEGNLDVKVLDGISCYGAEKDFKIVDKKVM